MGSENRSCHCRSVQLAVSEAFLRGITFKELAAMDKSQPLQEVEISLPPGSEQLLRTLQFFSCPVMLMTLRSQENQIKSN